MKNERHEALHWWSDIGYDNRCSLCLKYYPERLLITLTGREIEHIWRNEVIKPVLN